MSSPEFETAADQSQLTVPPAGDDLSAQEDAPGASGGSPAGELGGSENSELLAAPSALSPGEEAIYTIRLLTAVTVGAVVEGGDQLIKRLKQYEQQLQTAQAEAAVAGHDPEFDEDEFDRLRYAAIGLIFDTQNMIGRSLALTVKASEKTLDVANQVSKPFRDFFLFRPFSKRIEKRFDQMAERGQSSLARWTAIGRQVEPEGRQLATYTYDEIVDEFISLLAENPEVRALVAQQSIGLAAGFRDEVRERTVTSDNVLEDIARRILRRQPREELPEPPPEVKRWAGVSVNEAKDLDRPQSDE